MVVIYPASGASSEQATAEGNTPLHLAAGGHPDQFGLAPDPAVVNSLLEGGADPNARNRFGLPPLFYVLNNPSVDVVEALLNAGADPNYADILGSTHLHYAMHGCNATSVGVVEALLNAGADPNVRNIAGLTPLDLADRCENKNEINALFNKPERDNNAESELDAARDRIITSGRDAPRPGLEERPSLAAVIAEHSCPN